MVWLKSWPKPWPWKTRAAERSPAQGRQQDQPPPKPSAYSFKNCWLHFEAFSPNCWEILNLSWAWENELQMYVLQSKPSLHRIFAGCRGDGLHPLPRCPRTTCFLQEQCQHFNFNYFLFFILKGEQGLGEGRGCLLFLQKQDWFLEAWETPRCFHSKPCAGPFWSRTWFLFAKLHFQEVSDIENLFKRQVKQWRGKKKTRGGRRGEGGRGEKEKGKTFLLEEKGSCSNMAVSF